MKIDEAIVTKIAKLSRIKVEDSEKAHYATEISSILDWIDMLQEVNTDNVEAVASVANQTLPMREDKITDGGYSEEILTNAAASEHDCFIVPKVVDQG